MGLHDEGLGLGRSTKVFANYVVGSIFTTGVEKIFLARGKLHQICNIVSSDHLGGLKPQTEGHIPFPLKTGSLFVTLIQAEPPQRKQIL